MNVEEAVEQRCIANNQSKLVQFTEDALEHLQVLKAKTAYAIRMICCLALGAMGITVEHWRAETQAALLELVSKGTWQNCLFEDTSNVILNAYLFSCELLQDFCQNGKGMLCPDITNQWQWNWVSLCEYSPLAHLHHVNNIDDNRVLACTHKDASLVKNAPHFFSSSATVAVQFPVHRWLRFPCIGSGLLGSRGALASASPLVT